MEDLDRKFEFVAMHTTKGKAFTHREGVVFLAQDNCFLPTLKFYKEECKRQGVGEVQIKGIDLLIGRIGQWREMHLDKLKRPDIDEGPEERLVCRPNKKG